MNRSYRIKAEMVIEADGWSEQEVCDIVNGANPHLNFKMYQDGLEITKFKVEEFNYIVPKAE